ncbi:MAG: hypothetical protein M3R52_12245 [Acidobacteriota bacterium]|nr:hypothetical protein [Acidobacteriota bacterium]
MRAKKPAGRHFYRQGKTRVYLKPVDDTLAVRYNKRAKSQVRKTLGSLGQVSEIESQQLFIVHLAEGSKEETASQHLQPLIDKGLIESVAPVLRDEESQLLQVLTDEITVRFKPTLAAKERKQMEKKYGLSIARKNEFVPNQFVVKVPRSKGLDTLHVANELDAADEVEFAAPNFVSEYRR